MIDAETAKRSRYKLLTSMLATYGYGLLGTSAIQPLVTGTTLNLGLRVAIVTGMAFQAFALYLVPRGEKP